MVKYQIPERFIKRLKYIDTLLFSKLFIKEGRLRQEDLCKRYNIINESQHRAMGDIIALERVFLSLYEEYLELKGEVITYDEIIKQLFI